MIHGLVFLLIAVGCAQAQTYTVLKDFPSEGKFVNGVVISGNTFYGISGSGGRNGTGNIFKVNTDGTGYITLKDFSPLANNTNSDGAYSWARLTVDGEAIYGSTLNGGSSGSGVLFKLNPDGTGFTVLKEFSSLVNYTNSDGAAPAASLTVSGSTIYGSTSAGGDSGNGVLFKLNTDGTGFTVLKEFSPVSGNSTNSDGVSPRAGLILEGGVLYGTTLVGGSGHNGTVFKMNTDGTGFTVLKHFSYSVDSVNVDGELPSGELCVSNGVIYGTTIYGGNQGCGTVFRLNTDGTGFAVLQNFSATDGAYPGKLTLAAGDLFGTTGGVTNTGTIFKISTNGTGFTVLKNFGSAINSVNGDGQYPGYLVLSGNALFGTTDQGGGSGNGGIFKMNLDGTGFFLFKSFGFTDGASPSAALLADGTVLYGTTPAGGMGGSGTVFRINTDGTDFNVLKNFTALNNNTNVDGANPSSPLLLANGVLYGTAQYGGTGGAGAVFKLNTNGTDFAILKHFSPLPNGNINSSNSDGAFPVSGLTLAGSMLYGTAPYGGAYSYGTVFMLNTNGTGFTVMKHFGNGLSDGEFPNGGLLLSAGVLYGTTSGGGKGYGTVFKINTNGTGFVVISSFMLGDGAPPYSPLVLVSNLLYGTLFSPGSPGDAGSAYCLNTDGSGFVRFLNSGAGSELTVSGNLLYGTTYTKYFDGSIFKMTRGDGSTYKVLKFFGTNDGVKPFAGVTFSGGALYGATSSGGPSGNGTLYKLQLAPIIDLQPVSQTVSNGLSATFSVSATGSSPEPLAYAWFKNSTLLTNNLLISGTTTNLLTISSVKPSDTGNYYVVVSDSLGSATSSVVVLTVPIPDTNRPTLTFISPTAGQRWSNATFTVSGQATDNVAVAGVSVSANNSSWAAATLSAATNWTAGVTLMPGTNVIKAYAWDAAGNRSTTNLVALQFVVTNLLEVRVTGLGTLSPNYSNGWLELGRNYSMTATPSKNGFAFANWTASTNLVSGAVSTNPVFPFMMSPGLSLQASFLDTNKPKLTITAPTAGKKLTNALAKLIGTASDNWKVTGVWYQLNNGPWMLVTTANSYSNWTATGTLLAGTNTLKAYALDLGGNYSATNTLSVLSSNTFKLQLAFLDPMPMKTNGLAYNLQLSAGLNGYIQVSTNLSSWVTLTNFSGTNSILTFRDAAATNFTHRFYRAVIP